MLSRGLATSGHPRVQWLTDNGSIFAANRTLEIAAALNLEPCFTPVESPESNGMAEAFVKTFSATISTSIRFPTPESRSRASIAGWRITTQNTRIPGWATARRGRTLHHFNKPHVRSNGVNSTYDRSQDSNSFAFERALPSAYFLFTIL
jgi:transposase InsO family protein